MLADAPRPGDPSETLGTFEVDSMIADASVL
jgi:hypothetical protein